MSNFGQAALTIVGTVVGSFFGAPQLGFLLGSLAGSALFPTQLPTVQAPRLADLAATRSDVGAPIPRGWGTFPVPGNVIWQSNLREVVTTEEVGGKGAPEQTVETVTYYQDFAIGLCEGEDPITLMDAIQGVRRIWANGKLIYDRRPLQAGESVDAFQQRMTAAGALDDQMTIYLGTEDQLPDPTIEATLGAGNVSAFRGLAYVVFTNWLNKLEDGQRMPGNWKFEVYTVGVDDTSDISEYSNEILVPWVRSSEEDPLAGEAVYNYRIYSSGSSAFNDIIGEEFDTLDAAIGRIETRRGQAFGTRMGYHSDTVILSNANGGDNVSTAVGPPMTDGDFGAIVLHYNSQQPTLGFRNQSSSLACCAEFATWGFSEGNFGATFHAYACFADLTGGIGGLYQCANPLAGQNPDYDLRVLCGLGFDADYRSDAGITIERQTQAPLDPCELASAVPVPNFPGYCVVDGRLTRGGAWLRVDDPSGFRVLQRTEGLVAAATPVSQYPLNPTRPVGHPDYNNQAFWEEAYAIEVARGMMEPGLTYGSPTGFPVTQDFAYVRVLNSLSVDVPPVLISEIVEDICREAGLQTENVDTSDLDPAAVIGYVRTRVLPGRGCIEPLRQVGFFDVVESGRSLKFVRRGHASAVTFTTDDIGAYLAGNQPPPSVTTRKAQEVDLPRSIRVKYISYARDYEPGEQPSPARVDTEAVQDIDMEVPVVMTDTMAAQTAEVLWADAWNSRWTHETAIDTAFLHLEPTDVITLPVDGALERARIISIEDTLPVLRKLTLNRDDDGSYVSQAVAGAVPITSTPVRVRGPTAVTLLDLPPLQDADDDAGIYAAFRPLVADETFRGATLLRSVDGGGSYQKIGAGSTAVATGTLLIPLGEAEDWVFDEGNELRVELAYGTLESRTEDAVISGANAAAVGVHGRWEIVQFKNAELLAGNIWSLTGLLRGRRGTERFIGQSEVGDTFVMLSAGGLVRVPLQIGEVGQEMLYRAVSNGTPLESAIDQSFTGRGVALLPFSVNKIEGSRDGSNNLTITWIRRGRFGHTLTPLADVPLSEAFEDYEVEILNAAGSVVRTISVSQEQAVYSAAQQLTDFGDVVLSVDVIVYQLSQAVGRGPGQEATI